MSSVEGVLTARFCYNDYRDLDADEAECHPEPESDAALAPFRALLAGNEDDVGTVTLQRGELTLRIVDSLDATIANFCLGAIPDLVDRKHVVVRYFLSYGYLRLDPEASEMLVSGDFVPTVRVPRDELIPALVEVGRRYVRFWMALRGEDAEYSNLRAAFHEKLALADAALARWDHT